MKIKPVPVHFFDDTNFPSPIPFLQLFFAPNGVFHRMMMFIPHKNFQTMSLRETLKDFSLMCRDAIPQRTGNTNIQSASVTISQNVNRWMLLFSHLVTMKFGNNCVNSSGAPACAGATIVTAEGKSI